MTASRMALVLGAVTLAELASAGCNHSAVLPPPTAAIPPQTHAPLGLGGPSTPAGTAISAAPRNPWKPTVTPRQWKYIVLHHTATTTGSVETIHAAHLKNKDKSGNAWLGIGYHFVIGNGQGMPDGAIEPTFRWRTQIQGAHAGSANKDYNELGIGICLVGNFEQAPPSAAQRRSIKLLVQTLRGEHRIPQSNVVGHKDIRATSTECPGKYFPMAEILSDSAPVPFGLTTEGVPFEFAASPPRSRMQ